MKSYLYEFQGVYLAGYMLVRADDRTEADDLFKKNLPEYLHHKNLWETGGIKDGEDESVTVTQIKNGKQATLICDGDY